MAPTYRPSQALDFAKTYLKGMPLEDVEVRILNAAAKRLWFAAPWRWTVGVWAPVTVTAAANDFVISGAEDASTSYLLRAYVDDGQGQKPLTPEVALPSGVALTGSPNKVAYIDGSTPKLRINPVYATLPTAVTPKIVAWYKVTPPTITKANMNTGGVLVMPDDYDWVYDLGVLYYAYAYGDDPRAGAAQLQMGKNGEAVPAYSGVLGTWMEAINQMRQAEPMLTTDPAVGEPVRRIG